MEHVTVQGVDVPALGLGTAGMTGEACRRAVEDALELGYRHLDTAQLYRNEDAVGAGLAAADVPREEVFLVTKIRRQNLAYDDVLDSFERSLDRLGTDYVDLLLAHAPSRQVPLEETLGAFDELSAEGLTAHIGVSNFGVDRTREAMATAEAPILTNQVEYSPYYEQRDLLAFCLEHDLLLTAYTPLAKGKVQGDAVLGEIAERHGKTEAQVALRWLVQQPNVCTIPKAASAAHRRENLAVFDFELSSAEMERIFELRGGLVDRLRAALGL